MMGMGMGMGLGLGLGWDWDWNFDWWDWLGLKKKFYSNFFEWNFFKNLFTIFIYLLVDFL